MLDRADKYSKCRFNDKDHGDSKWREMGSNRDKLLGIRVHDDIIVIVPSARCRNNDDVIMCSCWDPGSMGG